jgi:hypothetical protein
MTRRELESLPWRPGPGPVLGRGPRSGISKLPIGFEVKEGEEAQPEEYITIFRGLRFEPDPEIGPEGKF